MAATLTGNFGGPGASGASASTYSVEVVASTCAAAGEVVFAALHWLDVSNTITINSVTDTAGNTWVPASTKANYPGDASRQIWMTRIQSTVAFNWTVTFNLSASTTFMHGRLARFTTNGNALNVSTEVSNNGASGTAVSTTYSTPSAEHLILTMVYGGVPMTMGGSLTKIGSDIEYMTLGYREQATASGGLSESVIPNGGGWGITVITFNTLANTSGGTAPSITTQPTNQSVLVGQTATFSVAATGTGPLTYQWQRFGTNISGATSTTYTTPTVSLSGGTANNGDTYRCVVSGLVSPPATSNTVTLTVNSAGTAPTITAQPASQSVVVGQTATFTVVANGSGTLSYQWKVNGTNSGTNSPSFSIPNAQLADSGKIITVVVTGDTAPTVTSSNAVLTVTSTPTTATTVTVTLTTDGTTPAANLVNLKWAYWDQISPDLFTTAPVAKGTTATTNASGVLTVSIPGTTKLPGQVGYLVVTNTNGTPFQAGTLRAFASPVTVS